MKRRAFLRHIICMLKLNFFVRARELLFPSDCALCGKTLLNAKESAHGLCSNCAECFSLDDEPRCSLCGKPLISEADICINCKTKPDWKFDRAITIFPYMGKYRELLKVFKFDKRRQVAGFLAEKLIEAHKLLGEESQDAVWVPVPPRAGKLKQVFWDQVDAIASRLESESNIKILRCLKRLPSRTQKELGRKERELNLIGKIFVKKKFHNSMKLPDNIILFDDVFTTGSTLSVCAGALKAAGAKNVRGICLFYD